MLRPVLLPIFLNYLKEKVTIYISKVTSDLELYQVMGCRVKGSGSGEIPLHRCVCVQAQHSHRLPAVQRSDMVSRGKPKLDSQNLNLGSHSSPIIMRCVLSCGQVPSATCASGSPYGNRNCAYLVKFPIIFLYLAISTYYVKAKVLVTQLYLTLCDPMDCSPPGSSILGISQARILEWVTIPFSMRSSQPDPGIEPGSPVL